MRLADFELEVRKAVACAPGAAVPARVAQNRAVIAKLPFDEARQNAGQMHRFVAAEAARPETLIQIDVLFRPGFCVFL